MVNAVLASVFGLINPFLVIYVGRVSGGMDKLGIAYAITVLAQSLTAMFVGRYSDVFGRRPFLVGTSFVDASLISLYAAASLPWHIYVLQGAVGVSSGVTSVVQNALVGDLAKEGERGRTFGSFKAVVGLFSAVGLVLGGYAVKALGFKIMLFIASAMIVGTAVALYFLLEGE